MIFGCDGALIGFAGTATDQLIRMHHAVETRDFATAYEIWDRLGPLARFCWRAPIRDYRARMKEVLVMQGVFPHAACRPPQLGVDETERRELRRLAEAAGLTGPQARLAAVV
jgi:4-hydroxy-tetrahydrodipicolinate synthase